MIHVVRILEQNVRDHDLVARYGCEEFVILLLHTDIEAALAVAGIDLITPKGKMQLAVSIGVAALPQSNIVAAELLTHQADEALYRAKRNGRNQVRVAG